MERRHKPRDRRALVHELRSALERKGSPRVEMALIALCTGASGFLVSFGLLRVGLDRMWVRYLVALTAAYLVFFCLLRLWLHLHGRRMQAQEDDFPDFGDEMLDVGFPRAPSYEGEGGQFGGAGASATWDGPRGAVPRITEPGDSVTQDLDLSDADEAVVPLLVVAALASALVASVWVVYLAPGMLAELLVDTALVGGLYHRIRREPPRSWIATALRTTALPFGATCALFVVVGWLVQWMLPEARSIGDAVRYLQAQQ